MVEPATEPVFDLAVTAPLANVSAAPRSLMRQRGRDLIIPAHMFLTKSIEIPKAAVRSADSIAVLTIEKSTPFQEQDVYWTTTKPVKSRTDERFKADVVMIRKDLVATYLSEQAPARKHPQRLVSDDRKVSIPIGKPRRGNLLEFGLLAFLTLVAGVGWILFEQSQKLEDLREEYAVRLLEAGDKVAAAQDDGRAQVWQHHNAERERFGDPISLIAEATTLLPDNAYLDSLKLHYGALEMTGSAVSATDIAEVFELNPHFAEVRLGGRTTSAGENGLQKFFVTSKIVATGQGGGNDGQ